MGIIDKILGREKKDTINIAQPIPSIPSSQVMSKPTSSINNAPTPTPAPAVTTAPNFGKVEESFNGTPQSTTYYHNNTPVAKITYGSGGSSTGEYYGSGETYNIGLGTGTTATITPTSLSEVPTASRAQTIIEQFQSQPQPAGTYGMPILTAKEAAELKGKTTKPYYTLSTQGNDFQMALAEGVVAGKIPVYDYRGIGTLFQGSSGQYEINRANIEYTQDIFKSVSQGTEFNKPYSEYQKAARESLYQLPTAQRTGLAFGEIGLAVSKPIVGVAEFGASVYSTIATNLSPKTKGPTNPFAINWKSITFGATEGLMKAPTRPSLFETGNVPIIGLEYPKHLKDVRPYIAELILERPGASFQNVLTGSMAYEGGKLLYGGVKSSIGLFKEEVALGSTKLGAVNTLAGEYALKLSPLKYDIASLAEQAGYKIALSERTFIKDIPKVEPIQIGKGDLIKSTKVGEFNNAPLYEAQGKVEYYLPKEQPYLTIKPKLSGMQITEGTISVPEFQRVSLLPGNIFTSGELSYNENKKLLLGAGQREIYQFGLEAVSSGRYSIGTRTFTGKTLQDFSGIGKGISPKESLFISQSKFNFKTFEKNIYKPSTKVGSINYESFFLKEGKTSGRPFVGNGNQIDILLSRVETPIGFLELRKSYAKLYSNSLKPTKIKLFSETFTPKEMGIKIEYNPSLKETNPNFMNIKRIFKKGEFDYLRSSKEVPKVSEDYTTLYHGTSDKFLPDILKKGLQSSAKTGNYQGVAKPLDYISLGENTDVARSFANRAVLKKGGSPVVLEIKIPKSELLDLTAKSSKASGVGEFRLKEVSPKYIKKLTEPLKTEGGYTSQTLQSEYYGKGLYEKTQENTINTALQSTRPGVIRTDNLLKTTNTRNRFVISPYYPSKNTLNQLQTKSILFKTTQKYSLTSFATPEAQNFIQPTTSTYKLAQSQIVTPVQAIIPSIPKVPYFNIPGFNFNFGNYPPIIPVPINYESSFTETYSYRQRRGRKGKTRYQPSFTSTLLGIYGKPQKIGKDTFGPFRPIPLSFKPGRKIRKKKR